MAINTFFKTFVQFRRYEDKFTSERVGAISLGMGIIIETHRMIPEQGSVYYQHIVSVAALSEREDCDNGLLWRIDNDKADATDLMESILTAIYHGIAKYPRCFTEADKNNLTIAQRCLLDEKNMKWKYNDMFHHVETYDDPEKGETLSVEVTSFRHRQNTVQKVTWTVEKTEGMTITTNSFTTQQVKDKEIVILSLRALEKLHTERLNNLCK